MAHPDEPTATPGVSLDFIRQMGGGAILGVAGGFAMLWVVNRIEIAGGLYPILVASGALLLFAGVQAVDASGFLAVYLARAYDLPARTAGTLYGTISALALGSGLLIGLERERHKPRGGQIGRAHV